MVQDRKTVREGELTEAPEFKNMGKKERASRGKGDNEMFPGRDAQMGKIRGKKNNKYIGKEGGGAG